MGAFSRRSFGSVAGPWFLFDANFELTPLEPGSAASSCQGLQWRPGPAGGTLGGRPTPRFRTISNSLLACKPVTMKHSDATEDVIMIKRSLFPRTCSEGKDNAVLVIGQEEWPLPIPLVRLNNTWRFDAQIASREFV